jgi:hypothetical protein
MIQRSPSATWRAGADEAVVKIGSWGRLAGFTLALAAVVGCSEPTYRTAASHAVLLGAVVQADLVTGVDRVFPTVRVRESSGASCDSAELAGYHTEARLGPFAEFEAYLSSPHAPGLRCVRVATYARPGAEGDSAIAELLLDFRRENESPDTTGRCSLVPPETRVWPIECTITFTLPALSLQIGSAEDAPMAPLTIQAAEIRGGELRVHLSYGGGCASHRITLLFEGSLVGMESAEARLYFTHDAGGDPCRGGMNRFLRYDLSPLKQLYESTHQSSTGAVLVSLHPPGSAQPHQPLLRYEF